MREQSLLAREGGCEGESVWEKHRKEGDNWWIRSTISKHTQHFRRNPADVRGVRNWFAAADTVKNIAGLSGRSSDPYKGNVESRENGMDYTTQTGGARCERRS